MTASVYLDKSKSRVVDEGSPEAAWKISVKDAQRLGLVKKSAAPAPAETSATADLKIPRRATSRGPKRKE